MSRREKLLARLQARPKDFTWDDLVTILAGAGFEVISGRGSRYKFFHPESELLLSLHKPHPANTLKPYVLAKVIEALTDLGEL